MVIKKFQDIIAWQKAINIAVEIYRHFHNSKEYAFKDQICKAAISISNNIAEGFDRSSDADFIRFLYIAKGSCSELQSMICLANKLNFLTEELQSSLNQQSDEISRLIRGLIKSISKKDHTETNRGRRVGETTSSTIPAIPEPLSLNPLS